MLEEVEEVAAHVLIRFAVANTGVVHVLSLYELSNITHIQEEKRKGMSGE